MTKLLLSSLTSLAFAATAFAQDPQPDPEPKPDIPTKAEIEKSDMIKDVETDMSDAMDDASDMKDNWDDDMAETNDDAVTMMEDEADETLPETEMASCPEGTELKDDGTCQVTENWTPER